MSVQWFVTFVNGDFHCIRSKCHAEITSDIYHHTDGLWIRTTIIWASNNFILYHVNFLVKASSLEDVRYIGPRCVQVQALVFITVVGRETNCNSTTQEADFLVGKHIKFTGFRVQTRWYQFPSVISAADVESELCSGSSQSDCCIDRRCTPYIHCDSHRTVCSSITAYPSLQNRMSRCFFGYNGVFIGCFAMRIVRRTN